MINWPTSLTIFGLNIDPNSSEIPPIATGAMTDKSVCHASDPKESSSDCLLTTAFVYISVISIY